MALRVDARVVSAQASTVIPTAKNQGGPRRCLGLAGTLLLVACRREPTCDYAAPHCEPDRVCAFVSPERSQCVTYAQSQQPMPAPLQPGDTFWCSQGGRSAPGRTHSMQGDLFALDLASPREGAVDVVAPVEGDAHVFDGCEERAADAQAHNDSRCGLGYGNHVKIWDGENLVLLAHLARVRIGNGHVRRGDVVGVMGISGAAGHRHVHVTVTRPRPGEDLATILRTPGWKGGAPVRYPLATDSMYAYPDELACREQRADAPVLRVSQEAR